MEQEDGKTGSFEDGSDEVLAACIEVHRHLGSGLVESANFNVTTLKLGPR